MLTELALLRERVSNKHRLCNSWAPLLQFHQTKAKARNREHHVLIVFLLALIPTDEFRDAHKCPSDRALVALQRGPFRSNPHLSTQLHDLCVYSRYEHDEALISLQSRERERESEPHSAVCLKSQAGGPCLALIGRLPIGWFNAHFSSSIKITSDILSYFATYIVICGEW